MTGFNPQSAKIALLAASGVSESEMTVIARALANFKTRAIVISPETGLIHSWGEGTWGHCYPADAKIETTLGSDYDWLILPGGGRHVDKLKSNPHTARILGAMFAMNKPVVTFAESEQLLSENNLAGDNAAILTYTNEDELNTAADAMIAHFEKAAPLAMVETEAEAA